MTAASHTPGPWGIAKSHIKDVIAIRTDGEDDGQCLAQVLRDIGEEGEDEANANLIAAAPDLLEAALLVIERWSSGDLAAAVRQLDDAVTAATWED